MSINYKFSMTLIKWQELIMLTSEKMPRTNDYNDYFVERRVFKTIAASNFEMSLERWLPKGH